MTNPDRMEATLGEPAILITDRKISTRADLLPILEKPHQQVACPLGDPGAGDTAGETPPARWLP